jgi:hypothetical protein
MQSGAWWHQISCFTNAQPHPGHALSKIHFSYQLYYYSLVAIHVIWTLATELDFDYFRQLNLQLQFIHHCVHSSQQFMSILVHSFSAIHVHSCPLLLSDSCPFLSTPSQRFMSILVHSFSAIHVYSFLFKSLVAQCDVVTSSSTFNLCYEFNDLTSAPVSEVGLTFLEIHRTNYIT